MSDIVNAREHVEKVYKDQGLSDEIKEILIYEFESHSLEGRKKADPVKLALAVAVKMAVYRDGDARSSMQYHAIEAAHAAEALKKAEEDISALTKAFHKVK